MHHEVPVEDRAAAKRWGETPARWLIETMCSVADDAPESEHERAENAGERLFLQCARLNRRVAKAIQRKARWNRSWNEAKWEQWFDEWTSKARLLGWPQERVEEWTELLRASFAGLRDYESHVEHG